MIEAQNRAIIVIPPINQNNAVEAIGMNTYLVNQLKLECDARALNQSNSNTLQWILVAIGVTLLILEGGFLLAALIASSPSCAQVGLYLIPPSVMSFSLIPLFAPTDYEKIKGLIDLDLIEFAEKEDREDLGIAHQGKIRLTPENIPIYHEIKKLAYRRKDNNEIKN